MSSSSNYECVNWIEEAISNKYLEYYRFEEFKNIESLKLHRKVDFHDNIINFYGVSEACSGSGIVHRDLHSGQRENIVPGTPKDYYDLYQECWDAAENGNLMAMYNLANKYLSLEDYENAIKFLEKAAEGEYVEAINALAYCNENGLGTMINLKKAEELYTKAAKFGYSRSAYNLGEMLLQDSDENKENLARAIIWFKEAADLGDDDAHRNLKILSQNPSVLEDLKNLGEQGCKNSAIMILMGIP
ncbi:unnamed protein product [Rhizophagus irregularis]|nr:unnamed protein product [Rhizophagus irregularis]